jgi:hypothetical protein
MDSDLIYNVEAARILNLDLNRFSKLSKSHVLCESVGVCPKDNRHRLYSKTKILQYKEYFTVAEKVSTK